MMLSDFFDMQMTAWLAAIGYSLCYGTIVAKMFRVFYIFRNPTAKKRVSQFVQTYNFTMF